LTLSCLIEAMLLLLFLLLLVKCVANPEQNVVQALESDVILNRDFNEN